MAINLDLYHEIRSAQKVAKRDPLKLGVYALIVLAILMGIYYTWRLADAHSKQQAFATVQTTWAKVSKQQTAAAARETECEETIKNATIFQDRTDHRFLWAPLLSVVAQTVPKNVQLTKLTGTVTGDKNDKTSGAPPTRCSMEIDGIAAGKIPREAAERFRVSLQSHFASHYKEAAASFKSLDDSAATVPLGDERLNTATFSIRIEFPLSQSDAKTPNANAPKPAAKS